MNKSTADSAQLKFHHCNWIWATCGDLCDLGCRCDCWTLGCGNSAKEFFFKKKMEVNVSTILTSSYWVCVSFTVMSVDLEGKICIADVGVWCFPFPIEVDPIFVMGIARDANKIRSDKTSGVFNSGTKALITCTHTHTSQAQHLPMAANSPTRADTVFSRRSLTLSNKNKSLSLPIFSPLLINMLDKMLTSCQILLCWLISKEVGARRERECKRETGRQTALALISKNTNPF